MLKMHHLALNCNDLKKQMDFYINVMGFKIAWVFNEGEKNEFVMLRLDDFCIELFQKKHVINLKGHIEALKHFAFQVDSIELYKNKLKDIGISIDKEIDYSSVLEGFKISFFSDPEGNTLELMEGYQDQ